MILIPSVIRFLTLALCFGVGCPILAVCFRIRSLILASSSSMRCLILLVVCFGIGTLVMCIKLIKIIVVACIETTSP